MPATDSERLRSLSVELRKNGVGCYFQREDELVIAGEKPAFPDRCTFWVTYWTGQLVVSTFLPQYYLTSNDARAVEIISGLLGGYHKAPYAFSEDDCHRFGLRKMSDAEEEAFES